jgi:WD40 repeat protein
MLMSLSRGFLCLLTCLTPALCQTHRSATPVAAGQPASATQTVRTDLYGDPLPEGALLRLGTVRWRHPAPIQSLAFSPDGRTILSCAWGTLYLWDADAGRVRRKLGGPKVGSRAVATSRDGRTLAAAGWSGPVRLWDVATGKELLRLGGEGDRFARLALSPDGSLLASVSDEKGGGQALHVWDVAGSRRLRRLPWDVASIYTLAFSPDGKTLAYGGSGPEVWLLDATTGKQHHRLNNGDSPSCVAFAPDGKTLAATGWKGLRLWDCQTGELRLECPAGDHPGLGEAVAFSPDGKTVAHAGYGGVALRNAATGEEVRALGGHGLGTALAFSPDGRVLACGGNSHAIVRWDVRTGEVLGPRGGHQGPVSGVAFAPEGRTLASAAYDGTIRVWDAATGRELRQARGHDDWVTQVVFSPDGRTLISAGRDRTVRWWEAASGRELRRRAVEYFYNKLALSPDGKVLACNPEWKEIHLWDAGTGGEARLLGAHKESVGSMTFAADGRVLVSTGYWESAAQLWDVGAGRRWRSLEYAAPSAVGQDIPPRVAVSPDGRTVALQGLGGTVRLWEVATGRERARLPGENTVGLAFSPDGRVLAVADRGGTVRLWGLTAGEVLARLEVGRLAHDADPALAFAPDGRVLVTVGEDTTLLVWPVVPPSRSDRSEMRAAELWDDLTGEDAGRAYRTVRALAEGGEQAVRLIKDRVRPVPPPDPQRVARLLAELDDDRFAVRERATRELEKLGELAAPAMREAVRSLPSPESRRRATQLLAKVDAGALQATPDSIRAVRAVEVLEHIGTPAGRSVLESLAGGAPGARLTEEAKASLGRLARRSPTGP